MDALDHDGVWCAASVLHVVEGAPGVTRAAGRGASALALYEAWYRVSFWGWDGGDDEWVPGDRVLALGSRIDSEVVWAALPRGGGRDGGRWWPCLHVRRRRLLAADGTSASLDSPTDDACVVPLQYLCRAWRARAGEAAPAVAPAGAVAAADGDAAEDAVRARLVPPVHWVPAQYVVLYGGDGHVEYADAAAADAAADAGDADALRHAAGVAACMAGTAATERDWSAPACDACRATAAAVGHTARAPTPPPLDDLRVLAQALAVRQGLEAAASAYEAAVVARVAGWEADGGSGGSGDGDGGSGDAGGGYSDGSGEYTARSGGDMHGGDGGGDGDSYGGGDANGHAKVGGGAGGERSGSSEDDGATGGGGGGGGGHAATLDSGAGFMHLQGGGKVWR